MKIDEVKEWIRHAEDDLFSAKLSINYVEKIIRLKPIDNMLMTIKTN